MPRTGTEESPAFAVEGGAVGRTSLVPTRSSGRRSADVPAPFWQHVREEDRATFTVMSGAAPWRIAAPLPDLGYPIPSCRRPVRSLSVPSA